VADAGKTAETVRVSVAEFEFVRRLVVAAATLTISVLESDGARIPADVTEKARDVQALYAELVG
jgi:hypothetical protein